MSDFVVWWIYRMCQQVRRSRCLRRARFLQRARTCSLLLPLLLAPLAFLLPALAAPLATRSPTGALPATAALAAEGAGGKAVVRVIAYNTWLLPAGLPISVHPVQRAARIVPALAGLGEGRADVLVLSEVFDAGARVLLIEGLRRQGFVYVTRPLGGRSWRRSDGGVLVASRWPIEVEEHRLFGSLCANTHFCLLGSCLVGDCLADKGIIYIRLNRRGWRLHLFATHLQAGRSPAAVLVRRQQLRLLSQLMREQDPPSREVVLVAGDLNVDRLAAPREYEQLRHLLNVELPAEPRSPQPTYDPRTNTWARRAGELRDGAYVDYVFYSSAHLQPRASRIETRPVRAGGSDLSDHHAVVARLDFARPAPPEPVALVVERR